MIRLKPEDIQNFQCPPNMVLVRPSRRSDELVIRDANAEVLIRMFIDDAFQRNQNAAVGGFVVKTPSRLIFDKEDYARSLEWDTDMELQEGDYVIYSFLQVEKAFNEYTESYILVDDGHGSTDIYILIKYDKIFVAKRQRRPIWIDLDEEAVTLSLNRNYIKIIPLNGYVLAEPIGEKSLINGEFLISESAHRDDPYVCVVHHVGMRCRDFLDSGKVDPLLPDDIVGRRVRVDRNRFIPLEYSLHASFDGDRKYWRFHRSNIAAIYEDH